MSSIEAAGEVGSQQRALITELIEELRAGRKDALEMAKERSRERRWKTFSRLVFLLVPMFVGVVYAVILASPFEWLTFSRADAVGVVRIEGSIASGETASADKVVAALRRAFEADNVKAVVLSIDSGGGAPVEAERINAAVSALRQKHSKPVVSVIQSAGASAAYMIAMHTDKVYAGRYSLVGSIGAVVSGWELHRALERQEVSHRTYASGPLKSMLNPFAPMSNEADAKAQELVSQIGARFEEELRAKRGEHLKAGTDYGTGELWNGAQAKALGLVDEIGTLEEVIANNWGLDAKEFGPRANHLGILGAFSRQVVDSVTRASLRPGIELR